MYQSVCREREIDHDHDALLQQQMEKDQQYNTIVKSLKDRVCTLALSVVVESLCKGSKGLFTRNVYVAVNAQEQHSAFDEANAKRLDTILCLRLGHH